MTDLDKYINEGCLLKQRLIKISECEKILKYLDSKKPTLNIPFSSIGWGYGNLIEDKSLNFLIQNKFICNFCENLFGPDFVKHRLN